MYHITFISIHIHIHIQYISHIYTYVYIHTYIYVDTCGYPSANCSLQRGPLLRPRGPSGWGRARPILLGTDLRGWSHGPHGGPMVVTMGGYHGTMGRLCFGYLWDMFGICLGYVWDILRISKIDLASSYHPQVDRSR